MRAVDAFGVATKQTLALVITIGALLLPIAAFRPSEAVADYDVAKARRMLEKIGRAVQLYRADYGFVEPALRNTAADAGLPPRLDVLFEVQGKPWSLTRDDFNPGTRRPPATHFGTFVSRVYGPERYEQLGDLTPFFRSRGERLILLADMEYDPSYWTRRDTRHVAQVLRLDGTVEVVSWDEAIWLDWATKMRRLLLYVLALALNGTALALIAQTPACTDEVVLQACPPGCIEGLSNDPGLNWCRGLSSEGLCCQGKCREFTCGATPACANARKYVFKGDGDWVSGTCPAGSTCPQYTPGKDCE